MNELPDKSQAELDADVEAAVRSTIGQRYEPRINRKRQELEDLESEYSQAIERYIERLRGEPPRNGSLRESTSEQSAISGSQKNRTTQNGSAALPTKRNMLLSVLPDFENTSFLRRDVDAKIIERWPQVEPKTETESKGFKASIASLLADLVSKGQLEAKKGGNRFDPTVYRMIDSDEDTLLKSGP